MKRIGHVLCITVLFAGCSMFIPKSQIDVEITGASADWYLDVFTTYLCITNNSSVILPPYWTVHINVDFWQIETEDYFTVSCWTPITEPIPPGLSYVTTAVITDYYLDDSAIDAAKTRTRVSSIRFF